MGEAALTEAKRPVTPEKGKFTFEREIVTITVASGEKCFLYADDFERIKAYGTSLNWSHSAFAAEGDGDRHGHFFWRGIERRA
jgi:hypothetical protein